MLLLLDGDARIEQRMELLLVHLHECLDLRERECPGRGHRAADVAAVQVERTEKRVAGEELPVRTGQVREVEADSCCR